MFCGWWWCCCSYSIDQKGTIAQTRWYCLPGTNYLYRTIFCFVVFLSCFLSLSLSLSEYLNVDVLLGYVGCRHSSLFSSFLCVWVWILLCFCFFSCVMLFFLLPHSGTDTQQTNKKQRHLRCLPGLIGGLLLGHGQLS